MIKHPSASTEEKARSCRDTEGFGVGKIWYGVGGIWTPGDPYGRLEEPDVVKDPAGDQGGEGIGDRGDRSG